MHPSSSTRILSLIALVAVAACSPPVESPDARPGDTTRPDATDDAQPPGDAPVDAQRCTSNAECSNDVYCDGEERCQGGVCVPGRSPCDDGRSCTMDSCDEAMRMCTNAPDDAMCGDMNACNGRERCNPGAPGALPTGCEPVREDNVIDCDDSNTCTIDACDSKSGCVHAPRDLDGDGFVDRACTLDGTPAGPPGTDCNDGDPAVYPGAPEVCNDNRDNNCDGRTDYADTTCVAGNDTCASAAVLPGPGTYSGSTVGLANDYALSCNTGSHADAVFQFTLTTPQDVTVSSTGGTSTNAAVALVADCAAPLNEIRCNRGASGGSASLRVRGLAAGTYRILVETGSPASAFRLTLRFDPPTTTPPEDVCPAGTGVMPARELMSGVTVTAPLSTLEDDHSLSCSFSSGRRDAVYRMTLTANSDVRITVTPPATGFASTFASFRNTPCGANTSERRCASTFGSTPISIIQRALPPGTYWLIVEHDMDQDVTVLADITPAAPVVTYALSMSPAGVAWTDVCAMAGSTRVLPSVDDAQAAVPMGTVPFPVRMFGNLVTGALTISSNGWLSLTASASGALSGTIPDPATPNLTLAPAWTDQLTGSEGICYAVVGTAPNRRFIVQWANNREFGGTGTMLRYEAVINEQASASGNNLIDFVYNSFSGTSRTYSAGVENEDGTIGTNVPLPLTAPRVVRFTPSM